MALELKVSEPKLSRCGQFNVRTVKRGNLQLGTIEVPKLKPGMKPEGTFWMTWHVAQLAGNGNVVRVNHTTLRGMSTYGVKLVGMRLEDGTIYRARLDAINGFMAVEGKFADVPYDQWEVTLPPEDERASTLMAKMRIARTRGQSSMSASRQ